MADFANSAVGHREVGLPEVGAKADDLLVGGAE